MSSEFIIIVFLEVVKYGVECLQNFSQLEQHIVELSEDDSHSLKHYFVEVYDSDFDIIKNSDGSTSFEICLPDTAFTSESTSDSNSQSGDFIFKINPTHTESLPIYIKIPANQMVFDHDAGSCRTI